MEASRGDTRPEEEALPKDFLPCYACAINNLENCTHVDTVNKDVNANAPATLAANVNTPYPVPVHGANAMGGTIDPPPSYFASCYPDSTSPNQVAFTVSSLQQRQQQQHQRIGVPFPAAQADASTTIQEQLEAQGKTKRERILFFFFVFVMVHIILYLLRKWMM